MSTTEPTVPLAQLDKPTAGLARSASVLSIGNLASRVLGLVREILITRYFGATGQVSAFRVASQVPSLLYDFLVGGMLSAALVPVLSEYAQVRKRDEFAQLAGMLISLLTIILILLVLALELTAPAIAWLMAGGFRTSNPELLPLTVTLMRLMAPAVWLFSMAGLLTAMLYAWHRFTFPAVATTIYNLGIVIAVPLLAPRLGIMSLAIGILSGSLAQLLLMGWDLQRAGLALRLAPLAINWRHPALIKILRLYAPIAAGLVVSTFQIGLDRRLASGTGDQSIAWMSTATTLQQMPLGLISVAIGLAALPRLSQYFVTQQEDAYRQTLGRGLRMVLLFMAPAAVGLWLLGEPVIRLLFQHGKFTPTDTFHVVPALNVYVIGMLFAALDFPLNFAFYARNNTLLPALVGVVSVAVYVGVALALVQTSGYLGLVWADSAKQASHALIMIGLLQWRIGRLGARVRWGLLQICCASVAMAGVLYLLNYLIGLIFMDSRLLDLLRLGVAGGGGLLVYVVLLYWVGLDEVNRFGALAKGRKWLRR
ncbi:MAG: murein biosynthesis integral membrane protein MurJ [Chloroflexi bacterium]|nr:murein biosynthesis integral membrane protein MurJ [Chloroflexota bacterium]